LKLIYRIASWDNLIASFYEAAKGKWDWPEVIKFYNNLDKNIAKMQREIITGKYEIRSYRYKIIFEKKKRLIMALPFYDRVVQWAVYRQINWWLDRKMIYHSYGSRNNKGTLKAVTTLQKWMRRLYAKDKETRYLKMDISKFFYRIDHGVLLSIFSRYYKNDPETVRLLGKVIECDKYAFGLPRFKSIDDVNVDEMVFDKGMPVGNLLSQLFANVYLNELDQYCKHVLKIKYYIRYMDDIVILNDDLDQIHFYHKKIKAFLLDKLKLDLNDKTCIGKVKSGITFLSRRVYRNKIKFTHQASKRMKKKMIDACIKYANFEIDFKEAQATLNSYYGELKHINCDGLKRWAEENVVLQRNRDAKLFKQKVRSKNEGIELSDHAQTYAAA
jgi:hypothetical protein